MKKWLAMLLLGASITLYAQTQPEFFIHVNEITGTGSSPADNYFISSRIANEAEARRYGLFSSAFGADYDISGKLFPLVFTEFYEDESDEDLIYYNWLFEEGWVFVPFHYEDQLVPLYTYFNERSYDINDEDLYVLRIIAKDLLTDILIVEQTFIYSSLKDIRDYFLLMMHNIFSHLSGPVDENAGSWRENWLFWGFSIFWSPRAYYGNDLSTYLINAGGSIFAELYFHRFLAAEMGLELISDWVQVSIIPGDYYREIVLEIPLLIKYVIKPIDYLMLEPFMGFHFNIPLTGAAKPFPLSWALGFQYGVKAGPSALLVNARLSGDFGRSGLVTNNGIVANNYRRSIAHIGVGYKFGYYSKQRSMREHIEAIKTGKSN